MDGMILYSPFHSIGLFSVFDPDYIRSVDVYSAGFGANYGGRISSVIDIKTRSGSVSQTKGKVSANPFSTAIMLEGPLKKGSAGAGISYLISGRQNYIDQTSPTVYPYIGDSLGLPYKFQDLYGKLTASARSEFRPAFLASVTPTTSFLSFRRISAGILTGVELNFNFFLQKPARLFEAISPGLST